MATLNGGISADSELIRISGASPDPGTYFTIDSEAFRANGTTRGAQGRNFTRDYLAVDRGVAGTTKATHSNGATLTPYYPDAPGGAGGSISATDGVNPPEAITDIVAAGAVIGAGTMTLVAPGTGCLVYLNAHASGLPLNTDELVSWDAADYDDADYFDPLDPTNLTVPLDGVYQLEGFANGDADEGDEVNGGTELAILSDIQSQVAKSFMPYNAWQAIFSFWGHNTVRLSAGEKISMTVHFSCESGGTTWKLRGSTPLSGAATRLSVTYLGPIPA